jgi:hypothetical protein
MPVFDRPRIALHEAGHVAGLLMSGRVPARVSIDWPEAKSAGLTSNDFEAYGVSRDSAPDFIVAILLGPLAEAQPSWPPEWPLDQDATDRDARQIAILAEYGRLDERGWYSLVRQAHEIASGAAFKHLVFVIASALEKLDELDSEQIRFLVGPETCRTYGIEPLQEEALCST